MVGMAARIVLVLLAITLSASTTRAVERTCIKASGASLPSLLYKQAFLAYKYANPNILIEYYQCGSECGRNDTIHALTDFSASDVFFTQDELQENPDIIAIPVILAGIGLVYNVEVNRTTGYGSTNGGGEEEKALVLDLETAGDIFMGKIQNWNHSKIRELNPGVEFPNVTIQVRHEGRLAVRTNGSGTTAAFTEKVAWANPEFFYIMGFGSDMNWNLYTREVGKRPLNPKEFGSNEEIVSHVISTPNTIG
eukprot:jgi/Bigna1/66570/fgenesh1_pg.1_\